MTIFEAAFIEMVVQASPRRAGGDTLGEIDMTFTITRILIVARHDGRKKFVWVLVRFLFFQNAFPWPSSLRCALLRSFGAKIGRNVVIRANVNISFPWRLAIGEHVWIGEDVGILALRTSDD